MLGKSLSLIILLAVFIFVIGGCKSDTASQSNEVEKVTEQQAKEAAEEQISEENLDEELSKIESEIESDINTEQ